MKAGITGHQNLIDRPTSEWVRDALTRSVSANAVTLGFTSLAVGADQTFASVLQTAHIPFVAIIPSHRYETTFKSAGERSRFRAFRSMATEVIVLDNPVPSEAAFYAAGKYIADESDILFAVWNGKPAKGLGGTADIVKYALASRRTVVHLDLIRREILKL